MRCRQQIAGLLLAMIGLLWDAAAEAETVVLRAAPHDGFGRIVFNWRNPVEFSVEAEDDRLFVRFQQPIEADAGPLIRLLPDYLLDVRTGEDGQSLTFLMRSGFEVRAFDLGSAVVIDLVAEPDDSKATASRATEEVPKAADRAGSDRADRTPGRPAHPTLLVRAGEHEGFSRLVFDWTSPVDYQVVRAGSMVTVAFDRLAAPDFSAVRRQNPRYARGLEANSTADALTVSFRVPEGARIRHLRVGPKVAIDVVAPETARSPVRRAGKPLGEGGNARGRSEAAAHPTPLVTSPPRALTPPKKSSRKDAAPSPLPDAFAPLAEAESNPDTSAVSAPSMAQKAMPEPKEEPSAGVGKEAPVQLRFEWDEPVGAAVFRRAGALWVAFDKPKDLDVNALRGAAGNAVRSAKQLPHERGTIIRLDTVTGLNPSVRRDGLAWIVELQQQPLRPESPIEVKPQPESPVGARLFLPITEPGLGFPVRDPEVGDMLVVIPVIPLGHGVETDRRYPGVHILASVQGVALAPGIDELRVRSLRQGVELTHAHGLKMSQSAQNLTADATPVSEEPLTRIFSFDAGDAVSDRLFHARQREHKEMALTEEGPERELVRLRLAEFHFANGFAAEALGILSAVARERPEALGEPEFRALRGASSFWMGRLDEAAEDLALAGLDGNSEAEFWRASVKASVGDAAAAARDLKRASRILLSYPPPLKAPLAMLAAEAAIDTKDLRHATDLLDALAVSDLTRAEEARLAYLQGKLAELSGDFEAAVASWEDVEASSHRPSRARAAVARTELLLRRGDMASEEAIEEFERLRFAWRGDEFEFDLLRRLGELYLERQDYRNGLRTLRQAATHFRDHAEAPEVTQKMADAFSRLYLDGAADVLPPVTAIALYDEFKELTPPGPQGDDMIRRLADRLVAVDLLDRGAELLDAQVKFRLKGLDKARVGTQLALIQLMAGNFGEAVNALDASEMDGLPEELVARRRHLRARAVLALERTDAAYALLEGDSGIEAERLRTEIHWQARDWPNAAQSLRRRAKAMGVRPGAPLDNDQARLVLNWTIALTLAGNERACERVRREYGAAMSATSYADAFRLIAHAKRPGMLDHRDVAKEVQQAERFRTFLAEYRDRLKTQNLSEIY